MKILLAVDGSADSRFALEALSRFPLESSPDLLLAHVCPVSDLNDLAGEITDQTHRMVEECREQGRRMLEEAQALCRPWAKSVHAELLAGQPARELTQYARRAGADLVVAGARGRSPISRFLLGSVSDSLAKYAPCSVLVVRPRPVDESRRGLRILVSDDGSPGAQQTVDRLAKLPLPAGSEVLLVHVVDTLQAYHTEFTLQTEPALTRLLNNAQQRLAANEKRLENATTQVETLVLEGTDAAENLLQQATRWMPDLIMLGSVGKAGWERILLGSVSTRVLQYAQCSVWIERTKQS